MTREACTIVRQTADGNGVASRQSRGLASTTAAIVNTLALSLYERTRELGLLRAVGTSRRQIRLIVRGVARITAVMGGRATGSLGEFPVLCRPSAGHEG